MCLHGISQICSSESTESTLGKLDSLNLFTVISPLKVKAMQSYKSNKKDTHVFFKDLMGPLQIDLHLDKPIQTCLHLETNPFRHVCIWTQSHGTRTFSPSVLESSQMYLHLDAKPLRAGLVNTQYLVGLGLSSKV